MSEVSYTVKVRSVEARRGVKGTIVSYRVSWRVGTRTWRQTFSTRAQADAYRARLLTAARDGEAFLVQTGLPVSWSPKPNRMSWYDFTLLYTEMKWPQASPNHRRGIAEALTDATEALLTRSPVHDRKDLRAALRWSYSERIRDQQEPPNDLAKQVAWLKINTVQMETFRSKVGAAELTRKVLSRIRQTQDGRTAAANTSNRKRMVLHNALEYAREIGVISDNPLDFVRWTKPRTTTAVDPRVVVNPDQARRFLAAVERHSDRGRSLKAFFAVMYYAALRPEEAGELRRTQLTLPTGEGMWGEMRLQDAVPRSGSRWTNTGQIRERVPLKHRAEGETRIVPIHPELVTILRSHLAEFGPTDPQRRIFAAKNGGPVTDRTYLRIFHQSRREAFSEREANSPLMSVPYSLRHAAVSTWLRTTGDAALVARWAGHSVNVLLTVYARVVDGAQSETLERIWQATRQANADDSGKPEEGGPGGRAEHRDTPDPETRPPGNV